MKLYDRFLDKHIINLSSLPDDIELGRYVICEGEYEGFDVVNSVFDAGKGRRIDQDFLDESNQGRHDVLRQIKLKVEKDVKSAIPLIQSINERLHLNEFERLLRDRIFHIEEICRNPHYLLGRTEEKVPVSRAKRITRHSFNHLSAHTEDWSHKSIVSFQPNRILTEEYVLNYDVYENRLTVAFIERALKYLQKQAKTAGDTKTFLDEYEMVIERRNDERGWHEKTSRNLTLLGSVVMDERNTRRDSETVGETERMLKSLEKRLSTLRQSLIFQEVPKRRNESMTLRNTNVLVNHRHYRYVKELWLELQKVQEGSERNIIECQQEVLSGGRAYMETMVIRALLDLRYNIMGKSGNWTAEHKQYARIEGKVNSYGVLTLDISGMKLRIVISLSTTGENNIPEDTLILQYVEKTEDVGSTTEDRSNVVAINPKDADSVERVGSKLRQVLLQVYMNNLRKETPFHSSLKSYVGIFDGLLFLKFDLEHCTFSLISNPLNNMLVESYWLDLLRKREEYAKSNHRVRRDIEERFKGLMKDINKCISEVKTLYLYDFKSGCEIMDYQNKDYDFNYIVGPEDFVVESNNEGEIILKNTNPRLHDLEPTDWGMDYLRFKAMPPGRVVW